MRSQRLKLAAPIVLTGGLLFLLPLGIGQLPPEEQGLAALAEILGRIRGESPDPVSLLTVCRLLSRLAGVLAVFGFTIGLARRAAPELATLAGLLWALHPATAIAFAYFIPQISLPLLLVGLAIPALTDRAGRLRKGIGLALLLTAALLQPVLLLPLLVHAILRLRERGEVRLPWAGLLLLAGLSTVFVLIMWTLMIHGLPERGLSLLLGPGFGGDAGIRLADLARGLGAGLAEWALVWGAPGLTVTLLLGSTPPMLLTLTPLLAVGMLAAPFRDGSPMARTARFTLPLLVLLPLLLQGPHRSPFWAAALLPLYLLLLTQGLDRLRQSRAVKLLCLAAVVQCAGLLLLAFSLHQAA